MKTVKQALAAKSEELEKLHRLLTTAEETSKMQQQLGVLRQQEARNLNKKIETASLHLQALPQKGHENVNLLAVSKASAEAHEQHIQRLKEETRHMAGLLAKLDGELVKLESETQKSRQSLQGKLQDVLEKHEKDMKEKNDQLKGTQEHIDKLQMMVIQKNCDLKTQQGKLQKYEEAAQARNWNQSIFF